MSPALNNIIGFLQLERIEENIFRGASQDLGTGQVFGGQVLGQALQAAKMTVADRPAHSVHAYFLRKGDVSAPIIYEVDRSRDGRSFTARRVVAIQHGRPIFTLSASFQQPEEGLDFETRIAMPGLPAAKEKTPSDVEKADNDADKSIDTAPALLGPTSFFEVRAVDPAEIQTPSCLQWWIKSKESLPDDVNFHRAVLAYLSDFGLLGSTLIPHGYPIARRKKSPAEKKSRADMSIASIDHAIWFHRSFRADRWLLYQCCAVSTSSARGLAHGSVYAENGTLVASTTQEGLIRKKTE
ncbi:MAG: acyl-CoA thioesterase [Pseudomonadales bacterium]